MIRTACWFLVLACLGCSSLVLAEDKKDEKKQEQKDPKDPLSKFSDEDLADVGFCFQKFVEAIGAKDAEVVSALLEEVPKGLAALDLKKPTDRESFVKAFGNYKGAQIVKYQRMAAAGIAVVTYADANGNERTVRMRNVGGRWKYVGD